ncbi:MAG TPA: DUF1707 and DUF4190 domain-containing protein [Actinopolymorphaceae bacterium]
MAEWHSMRASDADRQRAADLLKAAMAEGRLGWTEYQERLDRLMASKNYGEIHQVIADLPSGVSPFPTAQPAGPRHPVAYGHAGAPAVPPVRPNEPLATASLVCGVMAPFTCGISSVPAIITGHLALSRLHRTGDSGKGMAIAGLILGYLPLTFFLLYLLLGINVLGRLL